MSTDTVSLSDDLLVGCKAIAEFVGLDERQVYYWHQKKLLPTFKRGAVICARKSQLRASLSAPEVA